MSDSETFLLRWKKTWSDAIDDFTGRDPDNHFSFIAILRAADIIIGYWRSGTDGRAT